MLVTDDFHASRRGDVTNVDGLADFQRRHVNRDLLRQIFRERAHLELEQDVRERTAAGLDAGCFANRFDRDGNRHLFGRGNFVKIHMEHLAAERVMLDFLHQREALGAGIAFHGQIHEKIFRGRIMQQIGDVVVNDFQVLGLGLAAVDGRGHTAGRAKFFNRTALHERARKRFQGN